MSMFLLNRKQPIPPTVSLFPGSHFAARCVYICTQCNLVIAKKGCLEIAIHKKALSHLIFSSTTCYSLISSMATGSGSLFSMAAEQNDAANQEQPKTVIDLSQDIKIEPPRARGRKPNRAQVQKKPPQRGMGVAQLERLRLQERWKKMTDISQVDALHNPNHFYSVPHVPFTSDPIGGVPVLPGAAFYAGPTIGGDGFLSMDPRMVVRRIGDGGFGGFCGGGSGRVMVDQSRVGTLDLDKRVQIGGVVETAKELPSIQNMPQKCDPDRYDVCFKKKRSDGLNTGFNGGKDQHGANIISSTKSYDFLGFDREKNAGNFNGDHINGFGAVKSTRSSHFASHDFNEQVEVMAVHRKGNCDENGGSLVMEYEFFPGKRSGKITNEKMEWPAEASVNAVSNGEASTYVTASTASYVSSSNNPATSIDLSLKL